MRFDHRKVCRSLAELWRVRFYYRNLVEGVQWFGECVLITAKCVGVLQRFVGSVLTTAKCVGGLQCFGGVFFPPQSVEACRSSGSAF